DRSRAVQSAQRLHRDDVSAVVELHLRDRNAGRRTAAAGAVSGGGNRHIRARCGLSVHRGHGICRHGADGRRPLAQRLPLRLLHFGRHARCPCRQRSDRARLSGGPGARDGPARRRAAALVVLEPVLACAGYRLGRRIHAGLSDGRPLMSNPEHVFDDRTTGVEEHESTASYLSYTVGLALAILATIASFIVAQTDLIWAPGIPVGLIVLALAQIGVHLVFFLHLGSGSDSTNNVLALAFGVLIVFLVLPGGIGTMPNLTGTLMPRPPGADFGPAGARADKSALSCRFFAGGSGATRYILAHHALRRPHRLCRDRRPQGR